MGVVARTLKPESIKILAVESSVEGGTSRQVMRPVGI